MEDSVITLKLALIESAPMGESWQNMQYQKLYDKDPEAVKQSAKVLVEMRECDKKCEHTHECPIYNMAVGKFRTTDQLMSN